MKILRKEGELQFLLWVRVASLARAYARSSSGVHRLESPLSPESVELHHVGNMRNRSLGEVV